MGCHCSWEGLIELCRDMRYPRDVVCVCDVVSTSIVYLCDGNKENSVANVGRWYSKA